MSDSDEMESFDINDEDLRRAYDPNFKRKKMSKAQSMLGIWADSDDDDDEEYSSHKPKTKANIEFVSSSSNKAKNEKSKDNEEIVDEDNDKQDISNATSSDESDEENKFSKKTVDKIILDNLEELAKKQAKEPKPFVRKHSVFTRNKEAKASQQPQQQQQESIARKSNFSQPVSKKQQNEIGTWEKHTKGIGQKLMEKMGWEKGKGIGKDLQGRAVPVEAVVRKGKAAVGAYGAESNDVKQQRNNKNDENEEDELNDEKRKHVSQWKKDKNKKLNYNTISAEELLEIAATNPRKLKRIEQMLDSSESTIKSKKETAKIKIIDMTGKEQKIVHGYESISQLNKQSDLKKEAKLFDLPELMHNLDLLVNLTQDKLLNYDKKVKHTEDVIVNLEYEEKRSNERVKVEQEQIEKLNDLLARIEEAERLANQDDVKIEELVDTFKSLQEEYADEFLIFNLSELAIPLMKPILKRKMDIWSPFDEIEKNVYNEIKFSYEVYSELRLFLNESASFNQKSNQAIINPYHRLIWETWMPAFRRIISRANIRKYVIQIVDLITVWSSLLPKWILDNIYDQIVMPKLVNEVELWNPLTDTVPIHKWIHPWLPLIKDRLDIQLFPPIRFKLSNALVNWHPSDPSARAILLPWKPPVFSSSSWDTIMCRNILPKLDLVLSEELDINPNEQNLDPFNWCMSWLDLVPLESFVSILERNFFPKWLQTLCVWLNKPSPNYSEISDWYIGWKSLFNEKLTQHQTIKSKLSQGLIMMNKAVSGQSVTYQPTSTTTTTAASVASAKQQEKSSKDESRLIQTSSMPSAIASFKDFVERKAAEHNILFVQVPNKLKEGKQVYRFGNLNVYIERNVLFMLQNGTWIPASINEILAKAV